MHIKNLQKNIVILFVFLILIFSFSYVCAEDYFADIQITVDDTGVVDIDGITNHPDLLVENSNLYTYKTQSYWLINITKKEVFSDYIYILTLPKGAIVNHIKTSGFGGIEEESGKLIISGTGQNEELSIVVQLSDESEYEGGLFQISRGSHTFDGPKEKGSVIIFPSFVLHRVLPVTSGERNSLVSWISGPRLL